MAPLEFIKADNFGPLLTKKSVNRFLFVITDHVLKLVRTFSLRRIPAFMATQALVTHFILIYVPPVEVLSETGKQFPS